MARQVLGWLAKFGAIVFAVAGPLGPEEAAPSSAPLKRIGPIIESIDRGNRHDKIIIRSINRCAHKILYGISAKQCIGKAGAEFSYTNSKPVAMHQIVACITRAKSVSGCIHKLLPRDNRLSKYVMLQKIINTVTAGGVSVTNLGAEYIYRETDPVHPNITKALDIIDYNIKQCYELAPRVFISDVENCEHVYDTVVYLFKDGAANLEALQARFREMVEAWFDEMARDSNLLTAQVVSLITELTNATYIENLDQFNFKGIVLETLTAKANPWAVRMIEMIVSREDIAEEEVLQYIKDDKNAHVSPYFALQYILHVCHTQVKSDEWALGHLSDYFFKTRLVATKLRSLYAEPAELPFNPATLLYRIVFYMCSRPELKLEAPRFAGAVLRSAGRQAFKDLVWEAQTHGAPALLNDLPRSFTPGVRGVWEECLIENNAGI